MPEPDKLSPESDHLAKTRSMTAKLREESRKLLEQFARHNAQAEQACKEAFARIEESRRLLESLESQQEQFYGPDTE